MVRFSANCFTLPGMNNEHKRTATALIKAVALLQLKVLLGAARDLVVGPMALVAAFVDLMLLKVQEPRCFARSCDSASTATPGSTYGPPDAFRESRQRENVEALLDRVEEVVRDPQTGDAAGARAQALGRAPARACAAARRGATVRAADIDVGPGRDAAEGFGVTHR